MIGIYVLLVKLANATEIKIGKRHQASIQKGFYAYIESAFVGLEQRIARHFGTKKKLYGHIDYLLTAAIILRVIYAETSSRRECLVAQVLSQRLPSVLGFGSSDCRCASHLFLSRDWRALNNYALDAFDQNDLNPIAVYIEENGE